MEEHRKRFDRFDAIIILLSIIIMAGLILAPFKAKPFGDYDFHKETVILTDYIKGKTDYSKVVITRAPGPILFYTIPYLLIPAGSSDSVYWYAGVIWTNIFMIVSMLLLRRTGRNLFNDFIGKLAVVLFFIFPIHIYYSLGILAESVAFFSVCIATYGYSLWKRNKDSGGDSRLGWGLMTGGLIFLILNRPNALLVLGFLILVLLWAYWKEKAFFNRFASGLFISFIVVLCVGFGILNIAKKITEGKTSSSQERVLMFVVHEGRFQFRDEPLDLRYWDDAYRIGSRDYAGWVHSQDSIHQSRKITKESFVDAYKGWIIKDIKANPMITIRQFFIRAFYGHIYIINSASSDRFKVGPIPGKVVYFLIHIAVNLINMLILICSIVFLFKYRRWLIRLWPLWTIWFALVIFHGFTYMEPRYLMPSKPGMALMTAVVLANSGIMRKFARVFKLNLSSIEFHGA